MQFRTNSNTISFESSFDHIALGGMSRNKSWNERLNL